MQNTPLNNAMQATIKLALVGTPIQGPRGMSAYQIAVENGFVGTEAEWIGSLNGGNAGAAAGALAGSTAGAAAANLVVAGKANTNGSNVEADAFRGAIGAVSRDGVEVESVEFRKNLELSSIPSSLAPAYVNTLDGGLFYNVPANIRSGFPATSWPGGGYTTEMRIAVTGVKGSAVLLSTETEKVAGLGASPFSGALNAADGTNDFFVEVTGHNGSTQITLAEPLSADFSGWLVSRYDAALGQHLTAGATRALAQRVARSTGAYCSRGRVIAGFNHLTPPAAGSGWVANAALSAYGVSNSAAPVVQSKLSAESANLNIVGNDYPSRVIALPSAMLIGTHAAGHGGVFEAPLGRKDAVLEFFTGAVRSGVALTGVALRCKITVDGLVIYDQVHNQIVKRVRQFIPAANKVVVELSNSDGQIYYIVASQLSLREAGRGGRLIPQSSKGVCLMDSWGAYYGGAFSRALAEKSGAVVVNHSLGRMTSEWALAWFDQYVLAEKPDFVVFDFMINDMNQAEVPTGATFVAPDGSNKPLWPSGLTHNQSKAYWLNNIRLIEARCLAAGIQPIFVMPGGTSSQSQAQGLADWCWSLDTSGPAEHYVATAAELANVASFVNTRGKFTGRPILSGGRILYASSSDPAGAWRNAQEDAIVGLQRAALKASDYAAATTIVIGTDSNGDGLSDGLAPQNYGVQTGDTYTASIESGRQRFAATFAASGASGNRRYVFPFNVTVGKEYFWVVQIVNATPSLVVEAIQNLTTATNTAFGTAGAISVGGDGSGVGYLRGVAESTKTANIAFAPSRTNGASRTMDVGRTYMIDLAALRTVVPNIDGMTNQELAAFILALRP